MASLTEPDPTPTTGANTFDLNNRQTQANGHALSYDANGNLLGDATQTYSWDARNRLTQISKAGTPTATFTYDALNRRIAKHDLTAGITTNYIYDGQNTVEEIQTSDADPTHPALYPLMTGLGIDERYARDEASGRRYFSTDALGSTLALTDSSGAVKQTYAYEPYGEVSATGVSTNPYQYTGRENEGNGLYYYRARYYSTALKRFISEDPVGLSAGLNEHTYVLGNPISYNDPKGLYHLYPGVPEPSPEVARVLQCIDQCTANNGNVGDGVLVTATTNGHTTGAHVENRAADFAAPNQCTSTRAANCAQQCGASYTQNEYHCPSPNSTGGHIHFQTRPGLGGATGVACP